MYICGGFNVYPLLRWSRCWPAWRGSRSPRSSGVPDDRLGDGRTGVCGAPPGWVLDANDVLAFCRDQLANYKVPRQVLFRDRPAAQPFRQDTQAATAGEPAWTDQDPVDGPVRYEERERTAVITLNRPQYRNAQNSAMTYALDAAVTRAVNDPGIAVIVLAGAGDHFCAGHDIGSPGRDADVSFERRAVVWWESRRPGRRRRPVRPEMEVYLGMAGAGGRFPSRPSRCQEPASPAASCSPGYAT